MARLSRFAIALVLAPVACGKVTAPGESTVDAPTADAAADAPAHLTKPVAAITSLGIAGTQAQCTAATPSTGPGTISYVASWQLNGFPFTNATTTTIAGDTVPGTETHTNGVVECTLFATNGTEAAASDPVSVTFKPRLAYTIEDVSQTLETIDLDTLDLTSIGPLSVPFEFGDLAWDATTQTLYMVDGRPAVPTNSLYTVDVTTGSATLVGAHGVADVFGLGFDDADHLYATLGTGGSNTLRLANLTSGALTAVGGTQVMEGLAFDTKRAEMVGIDAGPGTLFTVDLGSGAVTQLASPGSTNDCGLTYDPFTDTFWAMDHSGNVFRYDPTNGYSRATPKSFPGKSFDAIAIVLPPP